MTYILRTYKLSKNYRGSAVVSDLNINVQKGEIYGLIGSNGAGKTTVMKMITNLVKPSNGEIILFGQKLTPYSYNMLKRMGNIIEYPIFYEEFTAKKNLEIHCDYMGYHNKNAIFDTLKWVNLEKVDHKPVKEFSLGMKQRLGIARAIITKPELIILDEPLNGLDPEGIRDLRELLLTLKKQYGMTFLVSSHVLGEIEQIADTVGVIQEGQLINEVSMDSIYEKQTKYLELRTSQISEATSVLENNFKTTNFQVTEDNKTVKIYDSGFPHNDIIQTMISNGIEIDSFNKRHASLEDYFLKLIQGSDMDVTSYQARDEKDKI